MIDRADVIESICQALTQDEVGIAIDLIRNYYPFETIDKSSRKYSEYEKTRIFVRDGFIDRYRGTRLIFPPVLRLLSERMLTDFPYHPNWKMDSTHIAYWELSSTIDHVIPVARGGKDDESNWVCCSMLTNGIKANWTLEECGWHLHEPGDPSIWDGMLHWFINEMERNPEYKQKAYLRAWFRAAVAHIN
jgi:hypothetical protein